MKAVRAVLGLIIVLAAMVFVARPKPLCNPKLPRGTTIIIMVPHRLPNGQIVGRRVCAIH